MADAMGVRNTVNGTVAGSVVQAGTVHQVVLAGPAKETPPVPRQLPPATRDFSGRAEHLAALDTALRETQTTTGVGMVTVLVLEGTAGVGKTTLAVWWAHLMQQHFPDGTLFVDLCGYGPGVSLRPHLVLPGFLSALGVAEERIPVELDRLSALFRSLLADRSVLVLLDNAGSAEQVRSLLPGSGRSLVLVTSRTSLGGLAVVEAARRVIVDLLDADEARQLVAAIIGAERASAEPEAVAELIEVCARLPLALRIAATRIAVRRFLELADVVEEIRGEQQGPVALSGFGDDRSAVHRVFDWSYARLPADRARMFRLLGEHPGPEFGVHAAAAVCGVELDMAKVLLEALADEHLIEPVGRRRYRLHDLLYAYAAGCADRDEEPAGRREASVAVLTWYARAADAADRLVFPGTMRLQVYPGSVAAPLPASDRAQALEWLDVERSTLTTAQRMAAEQGLHRTTMMLAGSARNLTLRQRALWPARLDAESCGVAAARAACDRAAEAFLLVRRGNTHRMLGDDEAAEADFVRVLSVADNLDDPDRRCEALCGLGSIHRDRQRYAQAWEFYEAALPEVKATGSLLGEAVVVCNLSQISAALGRFGPALEYAERELQLRRQADDAVGVAYAQHDVAVARQGLGDHETAVELCEIVVAVYAEHEGMEVDRAEALETAAASLAQTGQADRAMECLREAVSILTERGEPRAEQVRLWVEELAAGS